MAYIPYPTARTVPSPLALARTVAAALTKEWTRRAKRHEVERLLDCEWHRLEDMGITRADVHAALRRRDASVYLVRMAARRRAWREGRAERT